MKEKLIVGIICVIVLIGAIFTAITIRNNKKNEENFQENLVIAENPLTDECTEEYQIALQSLEIAEVNSSDDKISSNSLLTLKKY